MLTYMSWPRFCLRPSCVTHCTNLLHYVHSVASLLHRWLPLTPWSQVFCGSLVVIDLITIRLLWMIAVDFAGLRRNAISYDRVIFFAISSLSFHLIKALHRPREILIYFHPTLQFCDALFAFMSDFVTSIFSQRESTLTRDHADEWACEKENGVG